MRHIFKALSISLCMSLLFACANTKDPDAKIAKANAESEQGYYYRAQKSLQGGQMVAAVEKLEALEARFPFGRYAEQAQLEIIYAHFRNQDFAQASAAADRFIRLHPLHPQIDYALYVKGLATFSLDRSIFQAILPTDLSQRDMGAARDSFRYFNKLVRQYPNSPYYTDARARMLFLRNLLAQYEVNVGRFYIERGAYVAAVNRGNFIVQNFQKTPSVADGLDIMIHAYQALGLNDLSKDARKVMNTNYPNYYKTSLFNFEDTKTKPEDKSWLNVLSFGLLG
jgi:outer membrane protein assembly factor BamD